MSTSAIQSANALQDLAKTITARFDVDGDGRLSTDEFGGFLSTFLGSLQTNPLQAAASASATVTPGASAAATEAATRPVVGLLAGFDAGKIADAAHTTTKYQVARVLQHYPNTPAGLREALPELQQLFPGVTISGSKGDKLDFGSYKAPDGTRIGTVDVIQSAGMGGSAWQWMPLE
jgi:hypothetical protein